MFKEHQGKWYEQNRQEREGERWEEVSEAMKDRSKQTGAIPAGVVVTVGHCTRVEGPTGCEQRGRHWLLMLLGCYVGKGLKGLNRAKRSQLEMAAWIG